TTYNNKSIFDYGDVSTCSFHATKLFHTGEGGALFCKNKKLQKKMFYSHNFGHKTPTSFYDIGINGKMSELNAAMGLSVLPYLDEIITDRKKVVDFYNSQLNFSKLKSIKIRKNTKWNYSYYPIIFKTENTLLEVIKALNDKNIFPRRYFYPSLNNLQYLDNNVSMPISDSIAKRVLCLPLYTTLKDEELTDICQTVNNQL
ncbi:MAG TPA: DegT/DnrJ/EryC1/StrS family aminotransferase, partial [Bacteroidia bacterium]|nr:DegT/DnrJ/EryC1/StrS family aminotransferase [Bacteroidia bacterium]